MPNVVKTEKALIPDTSEITNEFSITYIHSHHAIHITQGTENKRVWRSNYCARIMKTTPYQWTVK